MAEGPVAPPVIFQAPALPRKKETEVSVAAVCAVDENGPVCGAAQSYGTSVAFLNTPAEAALKAQRERKLLFIVHVAGNFEDSRFT